MSEFLFPVFVLLHVRPGKESEAADCFSESSLFINSWVILYAFGGKVERSRPECRRHAHRGDGLILQALMNTRKVGAGGATGGRERRAPEFESLDGIQQRRQQGGVSIPADLIVVVGSNEYRVHKNIDLESNPIVQ